MGVPVAQMVKNLPANAEDPSSVPGWQRSLGEENCNPLQSSCLENFMGRGSWPAAVHGSQRVRHGCVAGAATVFNSAFPQRVSRAPCRPALDSP